MQSRHAAVLAESRRDDDGLETDPGTITETDGHRE